MLDPNYVFEIEDGTNVTTTDGDYDDIERVGAWSFVVNEEDDGTEVYRINTAPGDVFVPVDGVENIIDLTETEE